VCSPLNPDDTVDNLPWGHHCTDPGQLIPPSQPTELIDGVARLTLKPKPCSAGDTEPMKQPPEEHFVADLEQLSRDYSETSHRVLLVIGVGSPELASYLTQLNQLPHSQITAQTLAQAGEPSTRSLQIETPMQMLPEISRWLVEHNIALYQMRYLGL